MRWLILILILSMLQTAIAEDLNFEIRLKSPEEVSKNYLYDQVQFNRWDNIPGVIDLQLVGVHDVFVKQLRQRVKGQAAETLRSRYDNGGSSWFQYEKQSNYVEIDTPAYGNWWDRSWQYSLTPKNGGAPMQPVIKTCGWPIGIPDNFPILGWLKQKFQSFGDIWIDNTQDFDDINNKNRLDNQLIRKNEARDKTNYDRLERAPYPNIGIMKDIRVRQYRWYEGVSYHFRIRPSVKFRPIQGDTISEASIRFMMELYYNKKHFGNIVWYVQYDIPRQQTYLSAALVLINW